MAAQLLSLTEGPSIQLDKPLLLLGRDPECDIQIDSRKVSRRHCCVAQVHNYLVVRDLGSTNGVRINGVRLLEGKLHEGDELTIGGLRYQVTWSPAPHGPGQPPRCGVLSRRPAPARDDFLEDCEDPVPLDERGDAAGTPGLGDLPDDTAGRHEHPGFVLKSAEGPRLVIPDDLDLAPTSDSDVRSDVRPHSPGG